jgi:hypothetical protein
MNDAIRSLMWTYFAGMCLATNKGSTEGAALMADKLLAEWDNRWDYLLEEKQPT